jgi:hypothetical protein
MPHVRGKVHDYFGSNLGLARNFFIDKDFSIEEFQSNVQAVLIAVNKKGKK